MLQVSGLCKGYPGGRDVLRDIEFALGRDETLALVGPSGCGKTTLLYLLCGLTRPDAGMVMVDGCPVINPRLDVSIILQDYGLLPWKTVLDNVALGLKIQGVGRKRRNEAACALIADMGLGGRENEFPARLSGGEQQRVAIARAYVAQPKLLLMDEPFSSLDALTREMAQDMLLDTWRKRRVPYVLVTHSVEEAAFLGRRIAVLAGSPAVLAEEFDNPGFGEKGQRDAEAFYGMVRRVRKAMEKHW